MTCKVSIITPVYNESNNIKKCFDVVKRMSYANIEWVIVDDGSTDDTPVKIQEIVESAEIDIRVISQHNQGAFIARKTGILHASGDYICILDADDLLSDDAIQCAMDKMSDGNDICCLQGHYIDQNGKLIKPFIYQSTSWPITGQQAFGDSLGGWGIAGWFCIKKEIFIRAYDIYTLTDNNINDDEVITRLCFYLSNSVTLCNGIYYYVNNLDSTTKRVNLNYYRTLNSSTFLLDFVARNEPQFLPLMKQDFIYAFFKVIQRYYTWHNEIKNRKVWKDAIKNSMNYISIGDISLVKGMNQKIKAILLNGYKLIVKMGG